MSHASFSAMAVLVQLATYVSATQLATYESANAQENDVTFVRRESKNAAIEGVNGKSVHSPKYEQVSLTADANAHTEGAVRRVSKRIVMSTGYTGLVKPVEGQAAIQKADTAVLLACFQPLTAYTPLDMQGQGRTVEPSATACQQRCFQTAGCAYFSYWPDGGCHLQDSDASIQSETRWGGSTSGPRTCSTPAPPTPAPPTPAPPAPAPVTPAAIPPANAIPPPTDFSSMTRVCNEFDCPFWCLDGCHVHYDKGYINSRAAVSLQEVQCRPPVQALFKRFLCREPEPRACVYLATSPNGANVTKLEAAIKDSTEYANNVNCKTQVAS